MFCLYVLSEINVGVFNRAAENESLKTFKNVTRNDSLNGRFIARSSMSFSHWKVTLVETENENIIKLDSKL